MANGRIAQVFGAMRFFLYGGGGMMGQGQYFAFFEPMSARANRVYGRYGSYTTYRSYIIILPIIHICSIAGWQSFHLSIFPSFNITKNCVR